MKIIEAMKRIKHLDQKVADLTGKIHQHCALHENVEPTYKDQQGQIDEWMQSVTDTLAEIATLRNGISRTNLSTQVTISIGGKNVTKTIAYWIIRRSRLIDQEAAAYKSLNDRGLAPVAERLEDGSGRIVNVRRYFDVKKRDERLAILTEEPSLIDGTLEIVNATTDIIE